MKIIKLGHNKYIIYFLMFVLFLFYFKLLSVEGTNSWDTSTWRYYWSMKYTNTSSTKIGDSHGTNNLAITGGITRNITGKVDQAIDFDNSGSTYLTGSTTTLKAGPKSIGGWFKTNTASFDTIVYEESDSSCTNSFIILIRGDSGGYLQACSGSLLVNNGSLFYNDNAWHHVMFVITSTPCAIMYVDGAKIVQDCVGAEAAYSAFRFSGATYAYADYLDEWAYWNSTLTQTQITDIYNQGVAGLALDYTTPGSAPVISSVNCTSCSPIDTTEPYRDDDTTPTFQYRTDIDSSCGWSATNGSYSACSTTGAKAHICTKSSAYTQRTYPYIYFNCTSSGASTTKKYQMYITSCGCIGATGSDWHIWDSCNLTDCTLYPNGIINFENASATININGNLVADVLAFKDITTALKNFWIWDGHGAINLKR